MHASSLRVVLGIALLLGLGATALAGPEPSGAARGAGGAPPGAWSDGYTLVLLEPGVDLQAARRSIQEAGGTVALMLPPRILTGWIPPTSDAQLLGRAGIRSIHRDTATLPAGLEDAAGRAAELFFARAARGDLDRSGAAAPEAASRRLLPDAFARGDVSEADIAANLRAFGLEPRALAKAGGGAGLAGTSDYMSGTVSMTLFFVESDGSGTDPNLYDWTRSAEQEVFDEALAGLSWWSAQARRNSNCWVAFYVQAYFATQDSRCAQWREPVLRSSADYAAAIQQVLANFGYTSGNHLARAAAFDAAQRHANGTDWAYCAFVADNPVSADAFTDGYAAWAYIGGPYVALLRHSFDWPFRQVFAHESGHIFRACDEYYTPGYGGCTSCDACGDTGVPNGNCEQCNTHAVDCMMRTNSWALCSYTVGQIGWRRDPCSQAPLAAPLLTGVQPPSLPQGMEAQVDLRGEHFTYGMSASFGAGVQVSSLQVLSSRHLRADVRIDLEAAPGAHDIVITAADQQSDTLAAAFAVRGTPVHFVSGTGTAVYPYDSPAGASADLAAALAACSRGDTLLVTGGTYGPIEITKSVVLRGGWTDDFRTRISDARPSIVQAQGTGPALVIDGAGARPVIDEFVVRGGAGRLVSTAQFGTALAGGGVLCFDAAPTLRGCDLEDNTAGGPGMPGLGGGGFFQGSQPQLIGCKVRGNHAAIGAGLFFLACDARLQDDVVEGNTAGDTAWPARGAGLAALASRLEVADGGVRDNQGAAEGGGLHLENCARVSLAGVRIDGNAASAAGGGILARGSCLRLVGCEVTRNRAGERGGGLQVTGDTLEVESSVVAGNHAGLLGGGLHVSGCLTSLVNVTLARNDGGPGSGAYWDDAPSPGVMRGCIVAFNSMGGLLVGAGAHPELDWNDYWSNGGFDLFTLAAGPHDLVADPLLVDLDKLDLHLAPHSPGIDSGEPARADPDGSSCDRGAYGGPRARPQAPGWVQGVEAFDLGTSVRLVWNPSDAADIAWYAVYRDSLAEMRPSAGNLVARVPAPATSYFDAAAPAGAWFVISGVDSLGHAGGFSVPRRAAPPTDAALHPRALALRPVVPNPANPGTWVGVELPARAVVHLGIYTIRGRLLRVLADGEHGPGTMRLFWDGRDGEGQAAASGVYWVRLRAGSRQFSRKLVVVR